MNRPVTDKPPLAQHAHVAPSSEATQVEQTRAIAQVQGALVVAQQRPRDAMVAMQRIREACAIPALADRAFFKYDRGGQAIVGPSIHLAGELARCWGNIDFGIVELRRDEIRKESEMLAVAWDLETNTRVTNSFIVPHKRDKRGGPVALTELRDIYENNANAAARRLRECIFRILPVYVVEDAKALCMGTLQHGGGEPIATRAEKLLAAFAAIGVTRAQIEKRLGLAIPKITAMDIANLGIVYKSIERGEVQAEDEFPSLTAAAITDDLKGKREPERPVTNEAAKVNTPAGETQETVDQDGVVTETAPATTDPHPEPVEGAAAGDLLGPTEEEWMDAAQAMIARIDEARSIADLDVLVASGHVKPELDRMAAAGAGKQHDAVTGFIAEKRKGFGG